MTFDFSKLFDTLSFFLLVLAEDAIKAALSDYRVKQQDKKDERAKASS